MITSTIYALSSGALPSGVAIVRISGPDAGVVLEKMVRKVVAPRKACLCSLYDPISEELLDHGLVLHFPSPNSFTGEEIVELHCHGGVATMAAILEALSGLKGFRAAEAGEFSRRAYENGKLDLTQLEGLADIISANTEQQRKQALRQTGGVLRVLYDDWRSRLIRARALIEAELDFSDEDDIPGSVSDHVWAEVDALTGLMSTHLDDQHQGEIVRRGLRVALMGKPNAGKSSLLNALAKRDVAIVTPQAGTTRDVLEVSLDINGHLVTFLDTAGIRESDDMVEAEGIRRAKDAGEGADLVIWLHAADDDSEPEPIENSVVLVSKSDLLAKSTLGGLAVSTSRNSGLVQFLDWLQRYTEQNSPSGEDVLLTRQRHRETLHETLNSLKTALDPADIELRSEHLRIAADHLGRLTGRIDVEDLLDVIFSEFCVGK